MTVIIIIIITVIIITVIIDRNWINYPLKAILFSNYFEDCSGPFSNGTFNQSINTTIKSLLHVSNTSGNVIFSLPGDFIYAKCYLDKQGKWVARVVVYLISVQASIRNLK